MAETVFDNFSLHKFGVLILQVWWSLQHGGTWELVHNADSQALPWNYRMGLCILTRPSGGLQALKSRVALGGGEAIYLYSVCGFCYLIFQVLYKCLLIEGIRRKISTHHQAFVKNVRKYLLKSSPKQVEK